MIRKTASIFLGFSVYFFLISSASAEIYKWIDDNGKTQFSDREPEQTIKNIETLELKDIKINSVSEGANVKRGRQNYLNSMDKANQAADADKKKQDKEQGEIKKACRDVQLRLNSLNSGNRVFTTDKKGKRTYMDDDSRDKHNSALSTEYEKHCT